MRGERLLSALIVATVLLSAVGGALAADAIDDPNSINYDSDAAPNPEIETTVTVDEVQTDWSPTEYMGNNGELQTLPAHVNSSNENPVSFLATEVNANEFTQFPRVGGESDNSATWTNGNDWTTSGGASVTETTTAPSVDALNVAASSMTQGDTASAVLDSNVSIDSDEQRRYLQIAADVNTLDSDAQVQFRVNDTDGDYVQVIADQDNSSDAENVLAGSEADGAVTQVQLGSLTVHNTTGSDGSFNDIESVEVVVKDGNADVSISMLNVERMSEYTFGEQRYDDDNDGEMDSTRSLTDFTGAQSITSLDTMGGVFDDATIRNVDYDIAFAASDLTDAMDAQADFTEASQYPSYDSFGTFSYRLQLPDAYALDYSDSQLNFEAELPEDRYQTVQVAEAVGDTGFGNVSGWTDYTDTISTGEEVVVDNTIAQGEQIAIQSQTLLTADEKSSTMGSSDGGAMGPTGGSDDGGFLDFLTSIPGMIVSVVGGVAVWKSGITSKVRGWW